MGIGPQQAGGNHSPVTLNQSAMRQRHTSAISVSVRLSVHYGHYNWKLSTRLRGDAAEPPLSGGRRRRRRRSGSSSISLTSWSVIQLHTHSRAALSLCSALLSALCNRIKISQWLSKVCAQRSVGLSVHWSDSRESQRLTTASQPASWLH